MGASGSGTTTLARALADRWSVPHADADDYFWLPTIPPYREKRPVEQRVALMRQVFAPREAWVLSGAMHGWGEEILALADAVVFLTLDPTERLRRLEARERVRREGRPVDHAAWTHFREWARSYDDPEFTGRSRARHEAWLHTLEVPVLRLDSARSVEELVEAVLDWTPERSAASAIRSAFSALLAEGMDEVQALHRVAADLEFGLEDCARAVGRPDLVHTGASWMIGAPGTGSPPRDGAAPPTEA